MVFRKHAAQSSMVDTSMDTDMVVDNGVGEEWINDPNEPRYCLCNQVSYGDMVACDNEDVSIHTHRDIHRVDIWVHSMDLNDDLLPTLMGRLMAETRVSHDCPVTANMASRDHYLQYGVRIVDWTI